MPEIPSNLSLENIANGAEIRAQPLRDNFSDIQAQFNKLVAIFDGGVAGQALLSQGGSDVDWGDVDTGGSSEIPPGALTAYVGAAAPAGWLLCDGSTASRTTYADLFAIIGTAYGAGDGATTFNLPDLRGRVAVGKGTNASVDTLGENDGVTVTNRRPQHRHTPHHHSIGGNANDGGVNVQMSTNSSTTAFNSGQKDGGSGVATDALDAPAFLVVNYIVKT